MARQRKIGLIALVAFLALVTFFEADIAPGNEADSEDPRIDALLNTSAGRMLYLEETIAETSSSIDAIENELAEFKQAEGQQIRGPASARIERIVYGSYGPESYLLPEKFLEKADQLNDLHSFIRESQASLENFSWFVGRLGQLRPDSRHAIHEHNHEH